MPVLDIFVVLGRMLDSKADRVSDVASFAAVGVPVLAALVMAVSAVLSLVTIVAIYREGGILKRLRATPLRPGHRPSRMSSSSSSSPR